MTLDFVSSWLPPLIAVAGGSTVAAGIAAARRYFGLRRRRQAAGRIRSVLLPGTASIRMRELHRRVDGSIARRDPRGRLAHLLSEADVAVSPAAFVLRVGVLVPAIATASLVATREPSLAVFGAALAPLLAYAWLMRKRAAVLDRLVRQLPDALTTTSNALLAGASLPQAIEHAASEAPPPVDRLLTRATAGYRVGQSLEDVLSELKRQVHQPLLEVALAAMLIHRQVGGNLGELLADAAELMRDDLRLRRDLRVATAQAKLSTQVVGALPVLLVLFLLIASPTSLSPFFASLVGMLLFISAGVLGIVGFVLVVRTGSVSF